jgi:hypothetical protein
LFTDKVSLPHNDGRDEQEQVLLANWPYTPCAQPGITEGLKPRGVLFSSIEEHFTDDRYACFFDLDTWRDYVTSAGFEEVGHYYRPPGLRGISIELRAIGVKRGCQWFRPLPPRARFAGSPAE